jgi:hypothetical protein
LGIRFVAVVVVVPVAASGTAAATVAITADKTTVKFRGPAKNERTSNKNEFVSISLNAPYKFYLKVFSFLVRTHSFGRECVQSQEQSNLFIF